MALIFRGTRVYCDTSARGADGRVRGVYLGAGSAGLRAQAMLDGLRADRRAQREADREARRRDVAEVVAGPEAVAARAAALSDCIDKLFHDAMTLCGWYRHHRQWRRGRSAMEPGSEGPDPTRYSPGNKAFYDAVQALHARRLFDAADDVPALIKRFGGGLAERVRERPIKDLAQDPYVRESFRHEADMLRRDLDGERPSAIERLLAERAVVGWLDVGRLDLLYAAFLAEPDFPEMAAHLARLRSAADRSYRRALKNQALLQRAAGRPAPAPPTACPLSDKPAKPARYGGRLSDAGAAGRN
jgi:hypothetical protein